MRTLSASVFSQNVHVANMYLSDQFCHFVVMIVVTMLNSQS